jgi:hypothetical protein
MDFLSKSYSGRFDIVLASLNETKRSVFSGSSVLNLTKRVGTGGQDRELSLMN